MYWFEIHVFNAYVKFLDVFFQSGRFCVEFECVCMGFLWVLCFLPTVRRHAVGLIGDTEVVLSLSKIIMH